MLIAYESVLSEIGLKRLVIDAFSKADRNAITVNGLCNETKRNELRAHNASKWLLMAFSLQINIAITFRLRTIRFSRRKHVYWMALHWQ